MAYSQGPIAPLPPPPLANGTNPTYANELGDRYQLHKTAVNTRASRSTAPVNQPSNAFFKQIGPTQQAPAPQVSGGNRTSMHTAAGRTTNAGYTAGSNLSNARNLYQKAAARRALTGVQAPNAMSAGFFKNQAARPDFTYRPGVTQGNPTAEQQAGMQLRGNTKGQLRPADSPYGLGYEQYRGPHVRQHTLPLMEGYEGSEALDATMTYIQKIAPPPTPPNATVAPVAPVAPGFDTATVVNGGTGVVGGSTDWNGTSYAGGFTPEQDMADGQQTIAAPPPVPAPPDPFANGNPTGPGGAPTPPVKTPAPHPGGGVWDMTKAHAHWDAHNMGPKTFKDGSGNTRRTAAWTHFLTVRGLL